MTSQLRCIDQMRSSPSSFSSSLSSFPSPCSSLGSCSSSCAGQPLSLPPVGIVLPLPGHVGVVPRCAVLVDAEHVPGSGRRAVTQHITPDDRTRPRRPLVRLRHMHRPGSAAVEPVPTLGMRALPPRLTIVAGGEVVQQRTLGRVRLRALGDVGRALVGLVSRVNLGEEVCSEVALLREGLGAARPGAGLGPLTGVGASVDVEVLLGRKGLGAVRPGAGVGPVFVVHAADVAPHVGSYLRTRR